MAAQTVEDTARRIAAAADRAAARDVAQWARNAGRPAPDADTRWCRDCRTREHVDAVTTESHYDAGREKFYTATRLHCGHETAYPAGDAPTPGPYAGPHGARVSLTETDPAL